VLSSVRRVTSLLLAAARGEHADVGEPDAAGREVAHARRVGLAAILAWLAAAAGYSLALGAFRVRRDHGQPRVRPGTFERTFAGLQQMFGPCSSVAIGMLADFRLLIEAWPLVLAVTGAWRWGCDAGVLVRDDRVGQSRRRTSSGAGARAGGRSFRS